MSRFNRTYAIRRQEQRRDDIRLWRRALRDSEYLLRDEIKFWCWQTEQDALLDVMGQADIAPEHIARAIFTLLSEYHDLEKRCEGLEAELKEVQS